MTEVSLRCALFDPDPVGSRATPSRLTWMNEYSSSDPPIWLLLERLWLGPLAV